MTPSILKRDYRASSYVLASCVLGVILMRLVVYFIPFSAETYADEILYSAAFTVPVQLLFFLFVPFCIFKFYGKRTVGQTLEFSSVGGFKPYYLYAFALGIAVYFMTIGVSSAWSGFLSLTGYTYSSASVPKPETFSAGYFVADIALTALLPAVCEEFCMRGGVLTAARRGFSDSGCVLLCGIMFGLFHQNVRQVFYTALFGALAAYIVIKTKSLYPAVIMHFTNNFLSVYFDYATDYGWALGGGLFDALSTVPVWAVAALFFFTAIAGAALVVLILYRSEKQSVSKKIKELKTATESVTAAVSAESNNVGAQSETCFEDRIKPSPRDAMLAVSIGVVALLTTVFSYVWGFFY